MVMKSYKGIIVKVEESYQKEIVLKSGFRLLLDQNIKQVKDTIRFGEVISIPDGLALDILEGDILFFHHNIVSITVMGDRPDIYSDYLIDIDEGLYWVPINPEWPLAYARLRDGEFIALEGVCFLKPLTEEVSALAMRKVQEISHLGEVAYPSPKMIEEGIETGAKVYFRKNSEYPYYINGEKYYCMFDSRILAIA